MRNVQAVLIGILCVSASFGLGIRTAGDVHPISQSEAQEARIPGDVDGNKTVDIRDVIRILEIAQGYEEPTADELSADPSPDGELTVGDALKLLHEFVD